eukprot:gene1652-1837_t
MAENTVLEPKEVEELIIDTIENIQGKRKRANSTSVWKSLTKTHGLNDSATALQLTMMLTEGKIEDTKTGGTESFQVCEKARKISEEEERLHECRNGLLSTADPNAQRKVSYKGDSDVQEILCNEKNSGSTGNMEINSQLEDRFQKIEKQLITILERLNKTNTKNTTDTASMQDRKNEFQEILTKNNLLEREKRILKDENFALRLQIADLRENLGKNLNNDLNKNGGKNLNKNDGKNIETEPWQLPKRIVKSRQCNENSIETRNRFNGLERNIEDPIFSMEFPKPQRALQQSEDIDRQKTRPQFSQSVKSTYTDENFQRVVPGELSYAEAGAKPRKTLLNDTISQSRQPLGDCRKPTITVIGDSIVRGIRKQEINCNVRQCNSKDDPEKIAEKITSVATQAKNSVPKVAVSSLLTRGDSYLLEEKRVRVNMLLKKSLAENGIDFIEHKEFETDWRYLLHDDGIHLNNDGTNVLGNDL